MPDNEMTDSDRKHFSQYVTTLSDATLAQMANQLMDENPDSEDLKLINDEIDLRHRRARGPLYTIDEAAAKLVRLFRPELSGEEYDTQVQRTLAAIQRPIDEKEYEEG